MYPILLTIVKAFLLGYGGVVDFRKREIPNSVPIGLIIASIVELYFGYGSTLGDRLFMFGVVVVWIIFNEVLAIKRKGVPVPGGDIKLLCTLAFSDGVLIFAAVLIAAGVFAFLVKLFDFENQHKSFPLCTYVAAAYLSVYAVIFFPIIVR